MANRPAIELGSALLVAAVFGAGFVEALGYRGASAYMPLAITGAAVVLALIWAAQSSVALVRGTGGTFALAPPLVGRFLVVVVAAIVYVLAITYLGFFTATIVMVPALTFAIGYRNVTVTALATLGFCAVLYGVFRLLLSIPLPREAIAGLWGG